MQGRIAEVNMVILKELFGELKLIFVAGVLVIKTTALAV